MLHVALLQGFNNVEVDMAGNCLLETTDCKVNQILVSDLPSNKCESCVLPAVPILDKTVCIPRGTNQVPSENGSKCTSCGEGLKPNHPFDEENPTKCISDITTAPTKAPTVPDKVRRIEVAKR